MVSGNSKTACNLRITIGKTNRKNSELNRIKTTKYTLLTFLPINFYEQFRRAVYFYFLVVTIISFFVNTTLSPLTSLIPLLFVMIVTGTKEAYDDLQRFRNDNLVNYSIVTVYRNGQEHCIESRFICPGDLVVIKRDDDIPCDVVLLHSSDPYGKCYVTTANLDGETNLKTLMVPRAIGGIESLLNTAIIECESPKPDLYSFVGKIEFKNIPTIIPLCEDNLLLRGSKIKNTERIIGCAVYTGMVTKLQLNSRYTGNKSASSEIYINKFLIFLVVMMLVACIILYIFGRYEELNVVPLMAYLGPPISVNKITIIIEDFLGFLILFNYMIPISMYMNIEIYRVFNALFIQQDQHLYDAETDQTAGVNSSNLNEDLGQINILFSDKTGTLTKNEMVLQQCSINGRKFTLHNNFLEDQETRDLVKINCCKNTQLEFFIALSLCHTAQRIHNSNSNENNHSNNSSKHFQASSADEKSILEACAQLGIYYLDDENDNIELKISTPNSENSKTFKFKRLHILPFSSDRKRMSVIVSDENDCKWLYTKGAENVLFQLCSENSKQLIAQTNKHITKFASEGLRTLAVARRMIPEEEYQEFFNDISQAQSILVNRRELIENCYKNIECGIHFLGQFSMGSSFLRHNIFFRERPSVRDVSFELSSRRNHLRPELSPTITRTLGKFIPRTVL